MGTRVSVALNLVLGALLAWSLLGATPVTSAPAVRFQSYAAPAFNDVDYSEHNNAGSSACPAFVPTVQGGENNGDLDNAKGSFVHSVALPQRTTVRRFSIFVNDADNDDDVYGYLVRQRIQANDGGTQPKNAGYLVMAEVQSSGAVTDTIREFSTANINGARINPRNFEYLIEIVDCGVPEPFAAQIGFESG